MSKKQKTRFQKYLESQNLNEKEEPSKMNTGKYLSHMKKFYEENLEDFHEVESVNGMRIFSGNSEDGNCIITEHGGIFCESTGLVANPVTFLLSTEKLLTEQGAYERFLYTTLHTVNDTEGDEHDTLDRDHLFHRIESFRNNFSIAKKLESFGLAKDDVDKHPFWFDGLNRFFYLYLNRLNFPVCKYEWRFDGFLCQEKSYGVPCLIESPEADRIFFVENPMQLVSMSELYPEPVYIRPTARDYLYNDFSRLIQGKQIICMESKNSRSTDFTKLDLSPLNSNDPLDLLGFYGQGKPKINSMFEDIFREPFSKLMKEATVSISYYLKEKGFNL